MKTNLFRMLRSALALLLAFSMVVGYVPAAVFAAEEDPIIFVSIGDSMTNGYGLDGYDGESGVANYANGTYGNQFAAYLAGYTGSIKDDQVIFVGENGTVDHRQLAMSGMRAEDLHWVLTLDYEDDELMQSIFENWEWNAADSNVSWENHFKHVWYNEWGFKAGDFRTWSDCCDYAYRYADAAAKILQVYNTGDNGDYFQSSFADATAIANAKSGIAANSYFPRSKAETNTIGGYKYLQIATEYYQQSVKDADVISIALGNTNFGTYMLTEIMEVTMSSNFERFPSRYDIEDVFNLANLDAQIEATIRNLIDEYDVIIDQMFATLAEGNTLKAEALRNVIVYCVTSYVVNYVKSIETILAANPDVQIIQVALMNAYADESSVTEGVTLSDIVDILYTPINAFVAAVPTVMQATGQYKEAKFYYAEADTVDCLVSVFGDDFYKDCDNYVAYPGLLKGSEGYTANTNSTVRKRFVENIVYGQTFDMMASFGVVDVTLEQIVAYDMMTPTQKAAFAATNSAVAKSCALYLAFENATIKAGKGTVTLDSLAALGQNLTSVFTSVLGNLEKDSVAFAKENYLDAVSTVVAAGAGGLLTFEQVKTLVAGGDAAVYAFVSAAIGGELTADEIKNLCDAEGSEAAIFATVADKSGGQLSAESLAAIYNNVNAARTAAEAYGAAAQDSAEMMVYFTVIGGKIGQTAETVKYLYENSANADVVTLVNSLKLAVGSVNRIKDNYATIATNVAKLKGAVSSANSLCYLLGLPEVLSDTMYANDTLAGIMCMNARILIGTGIGGHPAQSGHDSLYKAIRGAYGVHTSKDQTIDNLKVLINALLPELKAMGEAYLPELLAHVNALIAEIEAQMEIADDQAKIQLKVAYEAALQLKAAIEKVIRDGIDSAIAEVKVALEALDKAMQAVKYLNNQLLEKYNALVGIAKELMNIGEYLKALLDRVDDLIAEIEAQLETADEQAKKQLQIIYEAALSLKASVEKALHDGADAAIEQMKAALDALNKAVEAAKDLNVYILEKYNALIEIVEELMDVTKRLEALLASVDALQNAIKEQLKTAEGMAKAKLEELYNEVAELKNLIKQMLIDGVNITKAQLIRAVVDVVLAVNDAAEYLNEQVINQIEVLTDKIVEALYGIYEGATHDNYVVDENSYYVAIGDSTAASNSYVDALAAELGVDYKNLAESGMMVADVYELLKDQKAEIEKADLITVGFGSNSFLDYAIDRAVRLELADRTNTEAPAALDWTVYVGEKGATKVEEKLAELHDQFVAEGLGVVTLSYDISIAGTTVTIHTDIDVARLMTVIVESYAYAVTSYVFDLPGIVEKIHGINADAVVAIVGMYNPIGGVSISLGETAFEIGSYADYLVDAANIHNLAYALLTGNAIFVEAAEVETLIVAAGTDGAATVDALSFLQMYINADIEKIMNGDLDTVTAPCGEATNPSAKGHEYIKTQIRNALTVTKDVEVEFSRMILGNELAMQFAFKQASIVEGSDYAVVVTKGYSDDRGDKTIVIPQSEWKATNVNGEPYYYVSFNGIAAKEMNDEIQVQVVAGGDIAVSDVFTNSIRAYALDQLRKTDKAETKTLYVDMLNYGAAAQTYFGYDAENLVNADLTEEEKAYGTETVELENKLVAGENYAASQLNLASSIQLRVKFNNINSSMKAVVKFTNHMGREIEVEVPGSEFMYSGTVVVVDEIVAADYAQDVTITVYNANGEVVANAVDSVASYIARMSAGDAIYEAVAKYCASAYAYLH